MLFPTQPGSERVAPSDAGLVFNRYGDDHYLSMVWRSQGRTVCELKQSKRERLLRRELARNGSSGQAQVLVAAQ
jgi:hypothetical protein